MIRIWRYLTLSLLLCGAGTGAIAGNARIADSSDTTAGSDQAQIRELFTSLMKAVEAQDSKAVVEHYAPQGFIYLDVSTPRAYYGREGGIFTWECLFWACRSRIRESASDRSAYHGFG